MTNRNRIELIRRFVTQRLQILGANYDQSPLERVLICEESYCGLRFELGELSAVWFAEENELKFYGADGSILEAVASTVENLSQVSRAA